jgi:4-amino-4-deoxy-L-arabinose transferase-like glycosyltransferase
MFMFIKSFIQNKINDRRIYVVLISLLTLAFVVRIVTALNMDIVYDELHYVYWIGSWFSKHFWEYFFQLQHVIYPPRTPVFANPPFGVWILTVGIFISQNSGHSILLGARIANVIVGVFLCFAVFKMGETLFDRKIGFLAAFFYTLSPQAVAADARAYLDTILSFLTLISLYFFYLYLIKGRNKYLIYSSIAFGLALLTKFNALYLWISILLICLFYIKTSQGNITVWKVFLHGIMGITIAIFLWAGLRDIAHINEVIAYRLSPPRGAGLPFDILNPIKLLFFQTSTIMSVLLVVSLLFYASRAIRKDLNLSRIFLLISFLVALIVNGIFASTFHVVVPLLPYLFLLASDTLLSLMTKTCRILTLKRFSRGTIVVFLLIVSQSIALFSMRIGFAGMYTNIFYSFAEGQIRVGDGEGMREASEWVRVNVPTGSKILVLGSNWVLHYYLADADTEWKDFPYSAGWIIISEFGRTFNITELIQTYNLIIIHTSFLKQGGIYHEIDLTLQELYGKPDLIVYTNHKHQIAVKGYFTKLFVNNSG